MHKSYKIHSVLSLALSCVFSATAMGQLEVFWDSLGQISDENFPAHRSISVSGGTGFETLGSNSLSYNRCRIIRRVTIATSIFGNINFGDTWLSEFNLRTIDDYETRDHAMFDLGGYDLLEDEQMLQAKIIPRGGVRYDLVYENLSRELQPFEDWHSIFSQAGGTGTLVQYHTASVEGANPLGARACINAFSGTTQFLSDIEAIENQAIAWKVEGEVFGILLGDINLDGTVDLVDVGPFVALLTSEEFQVEADINQDGLVDLLDVTPFVDLLTGG